MLKFLFVSFLFGGQAMAIPVTSDMGSAATSAEKVNREVKLIAEIIAHLTASSYQGTLANGRRCELTLSNSLNPAKDFEMTLKVDKNNVDPERLLHFKIVSTNPDVQVLHANETKISTDVFKINALSTEKKSNGSGVIAYQTSLEFSGNTRLKSAWVFENRQEGRERPAAHCLFNN